VLAIIYIHEHVHVNSIKLQIIYERVPAINRPPEFDVTTKEFIT